MPAPEAQQILSTALDLQAQSGHSSAQDPSGDLQRLTRPCVAQLAVTSLIQLPPFFGLAHLVPGFPATLLFLDLTRHVLGPLHQWLPLPESLFLLMSPGAPPHLVPISAERLSS